MNFCPECGAELMEDSIFCHVCGINLITYGDNETSTSEIITGLDISDLEKNESQNPIESSSNTNKNPETNEESGSYANDIRGQQIILCKNCGSNAVVVESMNSGRLSTILGSIFKLGLLFAIAGFFMNFILGLVLVGAVLLTVVILTYQMIKDRGKFKATCKKCAFVTEPINSTMVDEYIKKIK